MQLEFDVVDYNNLDQAKNLLSLLDAYAQDPMGGGEALADEVKATLIEKLATNPQAISILGYVVKGDGTREAIALANCFMGFSTFKAKPLINIHDCYVADSYRGQHVGQKLLDKIQQVAKQQGCCKITLEVLEGNKRAQQAYEKFGFSAYALDPSSGHALFWEKAV